ncbi:ABC transporter permease [Pararhizobium polonicum]|uniref:ABC transporter permease n=1 Tax=Pararhizobium polonicum TaxID=1612624 RepID=A0A1C7NZX7_9HYPH|nr:ABC transporter permease [Pararhizobium polonicum]OBZ94498.1 ABC transporter permease [Pararhizobium polonicum]
MNSIFSPRASSVIARTRQSISAVTANNAFLVLSAFASSIAIGLFILSFLGVAPQLAFAVMFDGAFGSQRAIADTLVFMTPRLLTALAALVALRCGFFNLGAEGQLQLGAIGAVLPATILPASLGYMLLPISIVCGSLFGAVWGLIPAVLKLWRGADEIIVTLMMNFIAIYLVKYLVQGPLQPPDSDFNMSAKITDGAALPILLSGTRLHAGVVLAGVVALAVWFMLYHTTFGVRLRAAGLSPRAARLQGMPLSQLILSSMMISGGIAGIGGAVEVLGVQYRLIDGFSSNLGFDGLAIALLGSLEPLGSVIVAIYFGAINSGTLALQSALSIPAALAQIMASLPIIFLACIHGYRFLKGRPLWSSTR